jgi:hypothetical protein
MFKKLVVLILMVFMTVGVAFAERPDRVPYANSTANVWYTDVVGSKADDAHTGAPNTTSSLMAYMKQQVNQTADMMGGGYLAVADSGGTTSIVDAGMAGYGDNYFNTDWVATVIFDAGGAAAAPEGETVDITDYVSSTGAFTVDTLTAGVAVGDYVWIHRVETAVIDDAGSIQGSIGVDDNNNAFASTSVAANQDGSVLERLEQLQEAVNNGTGTSIGTNKSVVDLLGTTGAALVDDALSVVGILGVNDADNAFASNTVAANEDGSILERLEQIGEAVNVGTGTSMGANKSIADALGTNGITPVDDAASVLGAIGVNDADNAMDSGTVAANEDGSVFERLEQLQEAVNKGTGAALAANKSLVDAIGSDGNALTDGAVSVIGVLGVNDADNSMDSSTVAANADGSVLERLEYIQGNVADTFWTTSSVTSSQIPNNTQTAGAITGAASGAIACEEIVVQCDATGWAQPTNIEFSTDNVYGKTGAAAPNVVEAVGTFGAQATFTAVTMGDTALLPLVLESGKKLYIHGDDNAGSGGGVCQVHIKWRKVAAAATIAAANLTP